MFRKHFLDAQTEKKVYKGLRVECVDLQGTLQLSDTVCAIMSICLKFLWSHDNIKTVGLITNQVFRSSFIYMLSIFKTVIVCLKSVIY